MLSSHVKDMLPKIQGYLATQPVEKAWLFGSCSRGEETPESDVDLLVRYREDQRVSLMDIGRMVVSLQHLLNANVDLVEEDCLLPFAQETANRDKILIYERKS